MWFRPERHGDRLTVLAAPDPLPRLMCQVCAGEGDVVAHVPGFTPALIRCPYCGPLHLDVLANPRALVEITSAH